MKEKKIIKTFSVIFLGITIITLLLAIFYNNAFIPSSMFMASLFIFSICYYIKDDKKMILYILFIIGIILIFLAIGYTYMRIM